MMDFLKKLFGGEKASGGAPKLPFESVVVPLADAVEAVRKAHRDRPEVHAFMATSAKDLHRLAEAIGKTPSVDETLALAQQMTVEMWRAELGEDTELGEDEEPFQERGAWPEAAEATRSYMADHAPEIFGTDRVIVFSPAPVARWWETFAHTRFGGWNACPSPAVHVMLARLWGRQHGAILMTHTHDFLEFAIAQPITTREEALAMAEVHAAYCGDNFNDLTLEQYAASLIGATVWAFWWD